MFLFCFTKFLNQAFYITHTFDLRFLYIIGCSGPRCAVQRAKFSKNVHKPPHWVNVINFELDGLDASIWVPWKSQRPQKSHDALIKIFKFIRNKLHFCTYIESETLKIYFEVCEPFR